MNTINKGKKINIVKTDSLVSNILCTVQSEKLLYFKTLPGENPSKLPGKDSYQLFRFNTDTIQIDKLTINVC